MQRLREEAAGTSVSMQFSATRKTVDTDYKAELHFRKNKNDFSETNSEGMTHT